MRRRRGGGGGSWRGSRRVKKSGLEATWKPLSTSLEGALVSELGAGTRGLTQGKEGVLKHGQIRCPLGTFQETGV